MVTLDAAVDADATHDDTTLIHTATGAAEYDSLTANLVVTVTDIDTAGVLLSPVGDALTVTEGTATETYTVMLATAPSGNVTVTITPQDGEVTTNPTSLDFTPGDWNTAQTVTLDAAEDADATHDDTTLIHTATGAAEYDSLTANLVVTVTDIDTAGVLLSPVGDALTVTEGTATETYTVMLATAPSGNVTVTITPQDGEVTTNPTSLDFTPGDWNTAQTVTLDAAVDADATHDDTTLIHTATGAAEYDSLTANLVVTVTDNDTAGLTLSPVGDALTVTEGTATETYTVMLATAPSGNVTVTITPQDGEVTTNPTSLDFTPGDWNTAQTVTLDAAEDADATHDDTTLIHTATGAAEYDSLTANLVVTVTDIDTAGVLLSPVGDALTVTEGTATETYTVMLATAPSGNVTVTITPQDGEVTTNPTSLDFTPGDWNTAQTVTLDAAVDADATHDDTTLIHTATGAAEYDSLTANLVVTVTDIDTAGVLLSPLGDALTVTEGTATETYTVMLATAPSGNVTVTITPQDGEVTTTPISLDFTPGDWNTAQTVTLDAAEDADATHDDTTLIHTATGAAEYDSLTANLVVTVTDNDTAGVLLSATTRTVDEGTATQTYTVALFTQPSANVTVSITPQDGEVTTNPTSLEFTPDNWNTAQSVTLDAAEDADATRCHHADTHCDRCCHRIRRSHRRVDGHGDRQRHCWLDADTGGDYPDGGGRFY